jgi:hypothetical protein
MYLRLNCIGLAVGCSAGLASRRLVFPIQLLPVANDLVIAGPRPGPHGPPWGNGHRPAVPREGSAVYADRARQTSRAILVYQDSVHRLQRPPLTSLTVRQDVHFVT